MKDRLKWSKMLNSDFGTQWRRDIQIEICLICSRNGERHESMG